MRLLILGGKKFLGRHLIELAQSRGWDLTLFNRGQTNPDLYPQIETIEGDRDGDLERLSGRTWDAVIDTCGYVPRLVGDSAKALTDSTGHYTFVSTISVYKDDTKRGMNEEDEVGTLEDPTTEEITELTYGPLKALCETAAEEAMPGRVLNLRPGLIVGPYDSTDRFSYWVDRVARGGDMLCPNPPHRPVQVIDGRDLASWMLDLVQEKITGLVQASGNITTFSNTLETCPGFESIRPRWVNDDFLIANEVTPWTEFPLWIPGEENMGFMEADTARAERMGLTCRPLAETTRDTLKWLRSLPSDREWKAGLNAEKEAKLLSRIS